MSDDAVDDWSKEDERRKALHLLAKARVRETEIELAKQLETVGEAAEGLENALTYGVREAQPFHVENYRKQQEKLDLLIKRIRTLDEIQKRPWEFWSRWAGVAGFALSTISIGLNFYFRSGK